MSDPTDDLIDQRLQEAFAPPPAAQLAELARTTSSPPTQTWRWLLAAAAALLVVLLLIERQPRGPEGHSSAQLGTLWVAAYDHAIDSGFGNGGCCEQGHDLAQACEQFCGQRLEFGGSDSISMLGCYGGLSTGGCLGLMLQVNGEPVCVFVVPRSHDPRPSPADEDLAWSRRELGPLVLYSLSHSPLDDVLDGFSLPRP